MASLILTLDVGTSSLRAMLFAADGDALGRAVLDAETQIKYSVHTTPDGGVELDPTALFASTLEAIDGALGKVAPGDKVVAVAMDTLWHSTCGIDEDGQPLTPLYLYSDTRAADAAARLRTRLDARAVHERTGCALHPSYLPAKLLWLKESRGDRYQRAALWLSFGEYLYLRLFGHTLCSYSMASGTGLLDVHRLTWDPEVLGAVGLDVGKLAPLGDRDTRFGPVAGAWAARWPALKDAPWFPALGDGACSNIGSGCATPARINLTVGTTGALRVVAATPDAVAPAGLFFYRVDKGRPLIGGATSEGGNLFAWMRDTMQFDPVPKLDAELSALEPDSHGLTVLPFIAGERAPGWVDKATATITGLTQATRSIDILRAGLEAIAYRFALILGGLDGVATDDAPVIASGGALLASPVWMGIVADTLNRRLIALDEKESTSRGAALLAMESLGLLPSAADAPGALGAIYEPDPARHARYAQAIVRQVRLYDLLVMPGQGTGAR